MNNSGKTTKKPGIYGRFSKNGNMLLTKKGRNFLEEKFRSASIRELLYANPRTNRLFRVLLARGYSEKNIKEFLHYEFCLAAIKWDGKTSKWNTFVTNGLYYGLIRMVRRPHDVKINNREIDLLVSKHSRKIRMENQDKEMTSFMNNEEKQKVLTELEKRINVILNEKEREIMIMKCNGKTLHEIAVKFNLTKERIRQIYNRSIEKIRDFYTKEDGGFPEYEF